MTTYNTGKAVGSSDPRDLYDNAENLDTLVNSPDKVSHKDRLGVERKSWHGIEEDFQRFLLESGYHDIGTYAAGLEITARNQIFLRSGEYYRAAASLTLPYTTTGDWATEGSDFVSVGDATLRQELAANGSTLVTVVTSTGTQILDESLDKRVAVSPNSTLSGLEEGSLKDNQSIYLAGKTSVGDGGGGTLYVDKIDTTTPADGINTFILGSTRIKRPDNDRLQAAYFGAFGKDGVDYTSAFEDVIDYINAKGSTGSSGKEKKAITIMIPNGVYYIPNGLLGSIDVDNVTLVGESQDGVIFVVETGELFRFGAGLTSGRSHGGGLRNIKFWAISADANQACIALYKTAHMRFEGLRLRDVGRFARLGHAANGDVTSSAHFSDIMGWVKNVGAPTFDLQEGAGFRLSDSYIYTNIPAPGAGETHTALAGQEFIRGLGNWDTVNVTNVNCNRYRYPINCQPASGKNNNNWYFSSFFGDYNAFGMRWSADGGNVRNHRYTNVWSFATEGDSFALAGGSTGLLENIDFNTCQAMLSGDDGFSIAKGNNISILNCTTQGQGRVSSTGYGVFIDGGDNVQVCGGTHGLDASATTPFAAQADYGVRITTNAKRYILKDITATGSINGYLIDKATTQPAANRINSNRLTDGSDANYVSSVNITVPASGGTYTNDSPFEKEYVMHGGTVSNVQKNGNRISTGTNITFRLKPDETFTVTYTAVPTVSETEVN
jgi:hypothetical protein